MLSSAPRAWHRQWNKPTGPSHPPPSILQRPPRRRRDIRLEPVIQLRLLFPDFLEAHVLPRPRPRPRKHLALRRGKHAVLADQQADGVLEVVLLALDPLFRRIQLALEALHLAHTQLLLPADHGRGLSRHREQALDIRPVYGRGRGVVGDGPPEA